MLKAGGPTDDYSKAYTVKLWQPTVEEIGQARFSAAFDAVMQNSEWFPDISKIRTAAGINPGICDPNEKAASLALTEIFEKMREFGVQLGSKRGRVIQIGLRDGSGWTTEPDTPAPSLDARSEAALLILGYGDRKRGLEALQPHPAVSEVEAQWRSKQAKDVESVWLEAWRRA